MKKTVYIRFLTVLLWLIAQTLQATNYFYIGLSQDNWNEPANWSPIGRQLVANWSPICIPSSGDGVTISGRGVILNNGGTTTIHNLTLSGGGSWIQGCIFTDNGGILVVPINKTLTANSIRSIAIEYLGTLDLQGTLVKQGANRLTINLSLVNTGVIVVEGGTLSVNRVPATTTSYYSENGSIAVNVGATLTTGFLNYSDPLLTNNGTISTLNNFGNTLTLNGTTRQTIVGNSTIDYLTLNNSNGYTTTGLQTVSNGVTISAGKIQLGNNDFLLSSSATMTGFNANNYIQTNGIGNLKRTVGTSDVLFPVGKSNYTPVTIRQASGTDLYAVRVSDGIDITHPLLSTEYINKEWNISRTSGNVTNTTVKLEWNSPADEGIGFTLASAQMLHHNGTEWKVLPIANRTTATGSLTQTNVTSFSPFSVGVPAFVLSAELIDFQIIRHKSTVDLMWQTASEKDVSHFEIEQSTDGLAFSKIGETKANNKASSYQFMNDTPLSILTYFRLKIVNLNGRFAYSKVLSVAFGKDLTVKAFPNPVGNELTIDVFSESKQLNIEVFDILGRSVFQKNTQNTEGYYKRNTKTALHHRWRQYVERSRRQYAELCRLGY